MNKTNDTKKKAKKIGMIIISVLIFMYSIIMTIKLIKNPSETFFVENGRLSYEENTSGYIIRDETIVEGNNYKNGLVPIKSEGEKVSKGESIFRYYSNNEENLNEKIRELDQKIQEALSKENNIFSTDSE